MTIVTPEYLAHEFPQVLEVFEQGRQRGLHHGLQLWVARGEDVLVDVAVGEALPGVPLTNQHHVFWLSAAKPLLVVLIAQEYEQGHLDFDDSLASFDDLGVNGKASVTIRHLLTHTAGLRQAETGWPELDWAETLSRLREAGLDPGAIPGETPGYHVASTWFLLAEVFECASGSSSWQQAMRDRLLDPCGMASTRFCWSDQQLREAGNWLAPLWERRQGELVLLDWHTSDRIRRPSPGSSATGRIGELGCFYQMLWRRGVTAEGRVLSPETVDLITSRQRVGMFDLTLAHIIDFGLGFLIDSNQYGADTVPYGYGRFSSERTFGHGGAQSSQGYCDPDRDLIVAYAFNGRPGEPQHNRRCRQLNEALYRDLGLTR